MRIDLSFRKSKGKDSLFLCSKTENEYLIQNDCINGNKTLGPNGCILLKRSNLSVSTDINWKIVSLLKLDNPNNL